ncbi:MFS transporter [Terasakiispira papahanaumokuakeensis]|uniref:MFS transporter n=1 Tax=Terasakiispira papahanaumokuakeensis TaxID=197479 RepID=A0A1E2V7H8_9GAMM|nr:YbfB/YjiJ family MFS transporter [Terasakiispira papahanaumokuakeensis]ODC02924.1 MFS transporter [Terasakiispira papahanaumokuakeensis]
MIAGRFNLSTLLVGAMATFVGIGLARFAYTPMIPALVDAHWFTASQAAYLGAANLLGYLGGAVGAHTLSERYKHRHVLGGAYIAVALSFFLCLSPTSFMWFFVWRFVSGFAGATLMVVGPSLALSNTPESQRPVTGAMVFTGIGIGAFLSATIIPLLLNSGLMVTWVGLGILAAAAGLIADRALTGLKALAATPQPDNGVEGLNSAQKWSIGIVMLAYAMDAIGFVPHTVFWVDYLAREVGMGQTMASEQWAVLGIGAMMGPFIVGRAAKKLGWHGALLAGFLAKAIATALPTVSVSIVSLSLSSFVVGAMIPGIVALTAGRLSEIAGPTNHKKIWGLATAIFAVAQAAGGYALSSIYAVQETYAPLFSIGAVVLMSGVLLLSAQYVLFRKATQTE